MFIFFLAVVHVSQHLLHMTTPRQNTSCFPLKCSTSTGLINPVSVLTRSSRLGRHSDCFAGCWRLGGILWGSASFPLDRWLIRGWYWDGSRGLVQLHVFRLLLFLQQCCFFVTLTLFILIWFSVILLCMTQRYSKDRNQIN